VAEPARVVGAEVTARTGYVIALSSVAAIGGFLFGFDSGVIMGQIFDDGLIREPWVPA
jgi:hypothetical protein